MDYGKLLKDYSNCAELKEQEDVKEVILRLQNNYEILERIALKNCNEDKNLITLLDRVFKENLKRINEYIEKKAV